MKIVIAGAAQVGTHLAKLLAREKMDVTLMDGDPERVSQLTFMNLMTMVGKPTSIKALKEAGVQHADLFIAVMPEESSNIHACILAANLGARRTVARVDTYEAQLDDSAEFYRRIGISSLVYPEMLGGKAIASAIMRPWARMSYELCGGCLQLVAVKVYDGAPIVGQKLMDLGRKHEQFHVAAISRKDRLIIPGGMDEVLTEDIVYFVTTPDKLDIVRLICGKADKHIGRVVIKGGSRLGIQTTHYLPKEMKVLVVEDDPQLAHSFMDRVPRATVQKGEVSDMETLKDIELTAEDAFVALGDNSGSNVLACLAAKKLGVGKTVAEVEDVEYISMAAGLNIGSVINKKLLTASSIYQHLLDADKTNAKCFSLVDAEVADLVAQSGSKITSGPVMTLGLPKGITLGGMVRNGKGMTITGQTQIQPGDQVVVVCMNEMIGKVEKLFR